MQTAHFDSLVSQAETLGYGEPIKPKRKTVELTHDEIEGMVNTALRKVLSGKWIRDTIEQGDCTATVKLIERRVGWIAFEITVERQHAAPSEKRAE